MTGLVVSLLLASADAGAPLQDQAAAIERLAKRRCAGVVQRTDARMTPQQREQAEAFYRQQTAECIESARAAIAAEMLMLRRESEERRTQEEVSAHLRQLDLERQQQAAATRALEEQRRTAEEEERSRRWRLTVRMRDDADAMQSIDSARVCDLLEQRARTTAAIADEHRYAKKAGVVNLSDLEDLKDDLRTADRNIAKVKADLRRVHRAALKCSDAKVTKIRKCAADVDSNECADDQMMTRLAIFGESLDD